jgi:hypothetical protein
LTNVGNPCECDFMTTVHDEIRSRIEAFTADISGLVREAALEAVRNALGTGPALAPSKPAAPARVAARRKPAVSAKKAAPAPKKRGPKAAPAKKAAGKKPVAPKRPLGAKRPPAELAALVEKLASYIKSNPGQGVEAIGKALNTATSELTLPIKKLLAAKRIRSEGQKRATRYSPA